MRIDIAMLDLILCGYQRDRQRADKDNQTNSLKQLHIHIINPSVALSRTKPL